MLKPDNRLKKVWDFNLIIKHGQWVSGSFLTLKWLKLAEIRQFFPKKNLARQSGATAADPDKFEKQLKLAFSVGLKVDKRAVARNRVRRQLSEVARLLIKAGRVQEGYYLMFVPKPAIKDKNYAQISQEVEVLLKRVGALSSWAIAKDLHYIVMLSEAKHLDSSFHSEWQKYEFF